MATRRKAAKKKATKKRSPARRVAKRAAKKRVAKKRVARRVAKKRPARRVAKRAAKKRVAKKRTARKVARRAAKPVRKAAKKRVARKRAARKVAKRAAAPKPRAPRPAAAPAAFAPQKAEATAKELLLFEIERARVAVMAAIQGLGAGTAMRPVGEGKWSIHEIVLHLSVSDRLRLEEFDALLAGVPASWSSVSGTPSGPAMNEANLAPLRERSWDDAVRLLMTTRAELLERLQAVPAEPEDVWTASHPFGAIMRGLSGHDRHHAEAIKNARMAG